MLHKAVFLDRDGVINVDKGFICSPQEITFIDGIFNFCRRAYEQGYYLIVVTNQSGIGRGLFSENDFHTLMEWIEARFEKEDCPLTAYYMCPHHPEAGVGPYKTVCECRKPKPGMILQAAREWEVDIGQSILIGDKPRDIEAGEAAGVRAAYLFSGAFPVL